MQSAFEIKNLNRAFGGRTVLDIEHTVIPASGITAVVGPNGCGKTTLLECMSGLQRPDQGSISFFGKPVNRESMKRMTMVFQKPYLFSGTVEKNVSYGLKSLRAVTPDPVSVALDAVGLSGFEKRNSRTLSGGEAKRVAIARALARKPEALLLDEPTADVDSKNTELIESAIRRLCADAGLTVVLATHSREQAVRLAGGVLLINNGKLIPFHPENHLHGMIEIESGEKFFATAAGFRIAVSTAHAAGPASCVIAPDDIVVSVKQLESSARNSISGKVTAVVLDAGLVKITIDAGAPLTAVITRASHDEIKPSIGDTLFLTFKATAVRVF